MPHQRRLSFSLEYSTPDSARSCSAPKTLRAASGGAQGSGGFSLSRSFSAWLRSGGHGLHLGDGDHAYLGLSRGSIAAR